MVLTAEQTLEITGDAIGCWSEPPASEAESKSPADVSLPVIEITGTVLTGEALNMQLNIQLTDIYDYVSETIPTVVNAGLEDGFRVRKDAFMLNFRAYNCMQSERISHSKGILFDDTVRDRKHLFFPDAQVLRANRVIRIHWITQGKWW